MKASGTHLLAEFDSCSQELLSDAAGLTSVLEACIEESGLSLISSHSHLYDPLGLTVVSIISESHVLLHTFPEARHVTVDVFTCASESSKAERLLGTLAARLKAERSRSMRVQRGELLEVVAENKVSLVQGDGSSISLPIKEQLYSGRSPFQQIDVVETSSFGRLLLLDNALQLHQGSTERYATAMLGAFQGVLPQSCLLLGCATLKLASVSDQLAKRKVLFTEYDPDLFSLLREFYLPSYETLCAGEAREFAELHLDALSEHAPVDALCIDMPEAVDAYGVQTKEQFFTELLQRLLPALDESATLSMHCGSACHEENKEIFSEVFNRHFSTVSFEQAELPLVVGESLFLSARGLRSV